MKTNTLTTLLLAMLSTLFLTSVLGHAQTVTNWSDNFDDGNGNNRWYAENGVWQIGTPTIGPGSAHSPPYCAATGLTANYPAGANSRLIRFQTFTVPAANQFPRLRFWQWYSFASYDYNDYGVVEVRVGTNAWQAVSPQYVGNSGGWTEPSVDLSAYSGQTVQVAFHMVFANGYNTDPGWYVDDIALETGTPVFNNPEGFEGGIGDWYAETGTWQVGTPTKAGGAPTNSLGYQTHGGSNCAVTVLNGNYPAGANSRFVSPAFVVPSASSSPYLRFWQWYSFASYDYNDYGVVEVRVGTNAWQAVSPQYVGNSGGWTEPSVDLSAYSGQTVQVAFHMVFANGYNTDPGWYVDDIALETGTPVFNNPEGFEGGIGDWYAETGTWQVGTPTKAGGAPTNSLGYQTHGGSNCAVTVLNGNYPAGANSRFVSPAFVVPSASSSPYLRFWQWYSFASYDYNDYGVVEVRVGTNAWQAVSPQYVGNSGGWTEPSVDLSAYSGQTVQVAFHMVFANGYNTDPGWYVDDIALETGTPVFNNPEGFEGGIGDWYAETGTWQVGTPTKAGGAPTNSLGYQTHGGSNCAVTVLNGNYPAGANSRFVSPAFVVPSASSSPYLRFWQWYSFASYDYNDYGVVEVRVGTNAWQAVSPQYVGNSGGWTEPSVDLSAYSGQTVQVAFHMVFANGYNTDPGWYVDDVSIQSFGTPVILTPPSSQTLAVGSSATLNVSASGDAPLNYQWRFNSNAIAGATNTTLTLANLQLTNTGYYDVVVTNFSGSVTSTPPALLQVIISFAGTDMGDPGAPGSFTQSKGVYAVTGSGAQISGTADAFYFIQQPLSGDCQIMARITGLSGVDPGAQAGIMIRESLDDGSKHASLLMNSSTNIVFRRRLTTDDYSIDKDSSQTNCTWLRLMRMGNNFIGLASTNGTNWEYVWFTTINMSNQVQVGLAVTAHQNASYATATIDNVSIGSLTPLPVWSQPGPVILTGGEAWSKTEFQRVGGFQFLLGSSPGDYFTVKGATNIGAPFSSWPALGTVTNTYGILPFLDTGALTNASQFYRLKRLGP